MSGSPCRITLQGSQDCHDIYEKYAGRVAISELQRYSTIRRSPNKGVPVLRARLPFATPYLLISLSATAFRRFMQPRLLSYPAYVVFPILSLMLPYGLRMPLSGWGRLSAVCLWAGLPSRNVPPIATRASPLLCGNRLCLCSSRGVHTPYICRLS